MKHVPERFWPPLFAPVHPCSALEAARGCLILIACSPHVQGQHVPILERLIWAMCRGEFLVKYTNLDGSTPDKGFSEVLRWQLERLRSGKRRVDPVGFSPPKVANDGRALASPGPHFTWVGHATFVFRLGETTIVTDPLWSHRLGPGLTRLAPPGIAVDAIPAPDIVTVSHSHYDHLDMPSLRQLGRTPTYVVPRGVGELLLDEGLPNVIELAWWQSAQINDVKITLVPAQHWSMRLPWDRNERLWGGFIYEHDCGVAYHAGDTAFSEQTFQAIAKRMPRIDWGMMPIGAYDPDWFMRPQHINPEDAIRALQILGVSHMIAMHWGTFRLTDEPLDEPPKRLRSEWQRLGLEANRLHIPAIGETLRFAANSVERRCARTRDEASSQ
jgi:N-acyl-phosphatidylethanolamine-hydrolysing phospholipase D